MRQFNSLQGNLANRFSGAGTGNRRSSSFQNAQTAASSNFAQDLASRRQQLQQQAINDLMGISNTLLGQRPQENFLTEKRQKEGFDWGGLAGAGLGAVGGFFAGGPLGALSGASLGYGVGSGKGSNTQFQGSKGFDWKNPFGGSSSSQYGTTYQSLM